MFTKRVVFLLLLPFCCAAGATLTIAPEVSFDCSAGLATVTLAWTGATNQAQIHVGKANGTPLTGILDSTGTASTGQWVYDGLTFYLVDQTGATEASAVAHVNCGGTPRTTSTTLAGGSYFPLTVGNTWVYKYSSRVVTNSYLVNTITGVQTMGGQTYFVLSPIIPPGGTPTLLRSDVNGVIWQNTSSGDQVYLDSGATGAQKTGYTGALGTFADALMPTPTVFASLTRTSLIYVRGLGLVNSQSQLLTGSSGGFTDGYDLIDAQVDGVHLSIPAPTVSLSIESTTLDLTNQVAPNCAIPCYFAACSVAGADPTGTYRPCAQTRVNSTGAPTGTVVSVRLTDPSGTAVFTSDAPSGLAYIRLPLYTSNISVAGFKLLPPGSYMLQATMTNGGSTISSSSIPVRIQ
jgi:hypothetical protein